MMAPPSPCSALLAVLLLAVPLLAQHSPAAAQSLPPGQPTVYVPGQRTAVVRNGNPAWHEVVRLDDDGTVTFRASYGCVWRKRDLFSPPVVWRNCDGRGGTQEILAQTGTPWPLTVGRSFSYTVRGQDDDGNAWTTVQVCAVTRIRTVRVGARTVAGYEVVCNDDWLHQTWVWSPDHGDWVTYYRVHAERGVECDCYAVLE